MALLKLLLQREPRTLLSAQLWEEHRSSIRSLPLVLVLVFLESNVFLQPQSFVKLLGLTNFTPYKSLFLDIFLAFGELELGFS